MAWGQMKPVANGVYWSRWEAAGGWYRGVAWYDNKPVGVYEVVRSMDDQNTWYSNVSPPYDRNKSFNFRQLPDGVFRTKREARAYCLEHFDRWMQRRQNPSVAPQ